MALSIDATQITNLGATTATSIAATKVSGVVTDNLLLLIVWCNPTETTNQIATPSGWTLVRALSGGATSILNIAVFYRIADGTEGATTTVTLNTATACHIIASYSRLSGHDPANIIDAISGSGTGGSSTSYTPPTSTASTVINTTRFAISGQPNSSGDPITKSSGDGVIESWSTEAAGGNPGLSTVVGTFLCPLAATAYPVTLSSNVASTWVGFSFYVPEFPSGIDTVTPSEFDMDEASIVTVGNNFISPQAGGTIYISDATTLAGSANEVDVSSAVTAWTNSSITLNLTNLSTGELSDLDTLGPGARYIIILNDDSDEYVSEVVTMHRQIAIALLASANIGVSGENTTVQLTAPAGKTTGDFGGGRIQDDENPTDVITTTTDEYLEDEWSLETTVDAVLTKTYEFRVLLGGIELSTETVTPEVTITAAGAATRRIFNL